MDICSASPRFDRFFLGRCCCMECAAFTLRFGISVSSFTRLQLRSECPSLCVLVFLCLPSYGYTFGVSVLHFVFYCFCVFLHTSSNKQAASTAAMAFSTPSPSSTCTRCQAHISSSGTPSKFQSSRSQFSHRLTNFPSNSSNLKMVATIRPAMTST